MNTPALGPQEAIPVNSEQPNRRRESREAIHLTAEVLDEVANRVSQVLERHPDAADEIRDDLARLLRELKTHAANGVARAEGRR
jgi:hypothetical protein